MRYMTWDPLKPPALQALFVPQAKGQPEHESDLVWSCMHFYRGHI